MLVVRELLLGSTRFNDIHRGVPRMSPALLSRRLTRLVDVGLVARGRRGRPWHRSILSLAQWSKAWLPATLSADRSDPVLVMWDMHRRMNLDCMPDPRVVIRFEFTDQRDAKRRRWIIRDCDQIGLCISDPGYEVDIYVQTNSFTVNLAWYGDRELKHAIEAGDVELDGPQRLRDVFPSWLQLNMMAEVRRRQPYAVQSHRDAT